MTALLRIAVRVPAAAQEAAIGALLALAPGGLEQVDRGADVELAVYGDDDQEERVRALFPGAVASPVADGWEERWRAFHRPVQVAGLWLGPPWETPPDGVPAVVIDPGRAFGTGAHPTTRLCVELLASLPRRGSLLDAGCGSGVLSIAAARLGFAPVVAVDVDPLVVAATEANAAANGVEVDVRVLDVGATVAPPADVVVANIELRVVERLLARVRAGTAITSGYLAADRLDAPGWRACERRRLDGWAADLLERA
jgi:ribosomal protein L11 methyltransferase